MNNFLGGYIPGLCDRLRERVLNTSIGSILLVPELADHLESDQHQRSKIGSWQYTMRQTVDGGRDILTCLPNDPVDGFQFSCNERDDGGVDVQLHDGNHRMIALYHESPRVLYIRDLVGRIKFIHCQALTYDDIRDLRMCDFDTQESMIEYWFPPRKGEPKKEVEDPGHDYETVLVTAKRCATPVKFRSEFARVVQVSQVPPTLERCIKPRKVITVSIKKPSYLGEGYTVAGQFTRWQYRPLRFRNGSTELKVNLKPGHSYDYKFFNPNTNEWYPEQSLSIEV